MNSKTDTQASTIKALAFVFAVIIVLWYSCSGDDEKEKKANLSPAEARKDKIAHLFSGWDGSLPELTTLIKQSMNDPDSYDHVETVYWDMDDHLIVKTTFRGNNKFGGKVKNWVKAKVDMSGKVLEIVEQGE